MTSIILALLLAFQVGESCVVGTVKVENGKMFMCIDTEQHWWVRRPHFSDLMPLVKPLPPPIWHKWTNQKDQECNPRDSKVGRALPLCDPDPQGIPPAHRNPRQTGDLFI